MTRNRFKTLKASTVPQQNLQIQTKNLKDQNNWNNKKPKKPIKKKVRRKTSITAIMTGITTANGVLLLVIFAQ